MLPIQKMFLTNHNRSKKKLVKLKGIVIHWTANTNKGANAMANRNYFNTTQNSVSAHYIVDDGNIVQCVPDDEIAYHVGATKYTAIGERIREKPYSPNYYLIGIEMCVNSDGDWDKTYQNTVELTSFLLKKYKLSIDDLYRHYDITGKDCPKMMINATDWLKFKRRVIEEMREDLSWKQILEKTLDSPDKWVNAIETIIKIADENIGDLKLFRYLPDLIEKVHKG